MPHNYSFIFSIKQKRKTSLYAAFWGCTQIYFSISNSLFSCIHVTFCISSLPFHCASYCPFYFIHSIIVLSFWTVWNTYLKVSFEWLCYHVVSWVLCLFLCFRFQHFSHFNEDVWFQNCVLSKLSFLLPPEPTPTAHLCAISLDWRAEVSKLLFMDEITIPRLLYWYSQAIFWS